MGADGLWVEFPEDHAKTFSASIFDLRGRLLASHQFSVGSETGKYHWSLDHTQWPGGNYKLVVKGGGTLRQTLIIK